VISGFFTLSSFISFAAVYHFTNPEIEIFVRFLDSDSLDRWAHFNLFNWDSFWVTFLLVFFSLMLSTIGLISAIFARHFHDKAAKILKENDEKQTN